LALAVIKIRQEGNREIEHVAGRTRSKAWQIATYSIVQTALLRQPLFDEPNVTGIVALGIGEAVVLDLLVSTTRNITTQLNAKLIGCRGQGKPPQGFNLSSHLTLITFASFSALENWKGSDSRRNHEDNSSTSDDDERNDVERLFSLLVDRLYRQER